MKALVYVGAFNPPTGAHIDLAQYAMCRTGADKVIYVPSKSTYIKYDQGKDFVFTDEERLDFLWRIAHERDWMDVSDYELKADHQPRTYETLCYLRDTEGCDCQLLFGSDKLKELEHGWKYVDEICNEFGIVCLQRMDEDCRQIIADDPFLRAHADHITVLKTPEKYQKYSSSRIRHLLKAEKPDIGELKRLLPPELFDLVA